MKDPGNEIDKPPVRLHVCLNKTYYIILSFLFVILLSMVPTLPNVIIQYPTPMDNTTNLNLTDIQKHLKVFLIN